MADAGLIVSEHQAGASSGAPSDPDMTAASAGMAVPEANAGSLPAASEADVQAESPSSPDAGAGDDAAVADDDDLVLAELPPPPVTVIAVHGNGGSSHRFSLAIPQMPAGTQMVAVTLPGFGGRPADPSLRSVHDYARNLGEIIARSPRPRVLLGHGVGGSIALQLAQRRDLALDGVILHAPVGAHLDSRWLPWIMAFPSLRALALRLFINPRLRPILRWFLFTRAVPQAYVDRFFDEYGMCSVFGDMFDMITPEWFGQLRPIKTPAALVWGMAERVLPVEHVNAFRLLLPDALVLRVPGWGHFPMAESPRSYADEIAELAQALVARSSAQRTATEDRHASALGGKPTGEPAAPGGVRS